MQERRSTSGEIVRSPRETKALPLPRVPTKNLRPERGSKSSISVGSRRHFFHVMSSVSALLCQLHVHQGLALSSLVEMSTVLDSQFFQNVFSTPESAVIWSDKTRTSYYLDFEAALAKVQAKLGIIPQKAADEIVKCCKWENLDIEELRRQTELIGYPVLPVVRQVVKQVNDVEPQLGTLGSDDTSLHPQDICNGSLLIASRM